MGDSTMSQLRVNGIATTAGTQNITLSSNGLGLDNKPIISGQIGSFSTLTSSQKIPFDDFWVQRGITYDSGNRRFIVPVAGVYRISMNPFTHNTGGPYRIAIGVNNDAPTSVNHRGLCYKNNSEHDTLSLNSVVSLSAGDFIVFYIISGQIYNATNDRFNQFTIERIA
jgi:hypothetical protein